MMNSDRSWRSRDAVSASRFMNIELDQAGSCRASLKGDIPQLVLRPPGPSCRFAATCTSLDLDPGGSAVGTRVFLVNTSPSVCADPECEAC